MTTTLETIDHNPATDRIGQVRYVVTDADIAETKERYGVLVATTRDGYEQVRLAIGEVRGTRVAIEKRRVELKADALTWGRKVDSEAKRLTAMLLEIEEPLKAKKQAVDDERDRARREKEEAEKRAVEAQIRAEREAEEARLKAVREAEEARLKAVRDAEEARLREENARLAAERANLAEERRIAVAERDAQLAEDAERRRQIADEQRTIDAARLKAEREEFERQAKITAEHEAAAKAERGRIAAEEARVRELERQAAEAKRLEAIKPDVEKLHDFAKRVRTLAVGSPTTTTREGRMAIYLAQEELGATALALEGFGK